MDFEFGSLSSSSPKKLVALVTSLKASSNIAGSGVNYSKCSKLYFKSVSGSLKSAVGGPKWWDGLPYRGPLGPSTVSLTAAALLVLSDGEG